MKGVVRVRVVAPGVGRRKSWRCESGDRDRPDHETAEVPVCGSLAGLLLLLLPLRRFRAVFRGALRGMAKMQRHNGSDHQVEETRHRHREGRERGGKRGVLERDCGEKDESPFDHGEERAN